MKSPVAPSSFPLRAGRLVTFGVLVAALPCLGGCPGNLDNEINSIPDGSGGDSGSGGAVGTGGSTASGGTIGSGGTTGSGGTAPATGGVTGTATGGTVAATGGTSGPAGGKSGSGGMTAAGGSKGSGGSGAGGKMGGTGGSGTVATCDAPTKVFKDATVGCIDSGCHAAGAGNQGPDLQTADPTALKAYKPKLLCMGGTLVVPSNPTSSVLWKVVDGTSCGVLMPQGKPALSKDQEDCLAAWIANIK